MNFLTFEDELDYLTNIMENETHKDWDKAVSELRISCHPDTIRKSWGVGRYCGYNVMKYFQNKQTKYLSDDEIKKLEDLKDEIYKERVKNNDILREKRNILREEARFSKLVEILEEKLDLLEPEKNYNIPNLDNGEAEAVVILSDVHYGMTCDNLKNFYDIETSKYRLNIWAQKVVEYCKKNKVKKLHLGLNGDLVSGYIHLQHRVSQEEDIIDQTINMGEILSNLICKIKDNVDILKVYGCIGNHSRCIPNKKENINSENFERIIFKHIEIRTGIKVIQNGTQDYITLKVNNKLCVMSHGDKDTLSNAKQHFCNLLGEIPDVIYLGHIHHMNLKDDNGTEVVVNGSVISSDSYAIGLRLNTKPYQIMQIFDGEDVNTIKLNLE